MNFLPIALVLFLLTKGNNSNLKNLLSSIDLQSFAPLLSLFGVDEKIINTLSQDSFVDILNGNINMTTLLPLAMQFLSSPSKKQQPTEVVTENEQKKDAYDENHKHPKNLNNNYLKPIKNIATDELFTSLDCYFTNV